MLLVVIDLPAASGLSQMLLKDVGVAAEVELTVAVVTVVVISVAGTRSRSSNIIGSGLSNRIRT